MQSDAKNSLSLGDVYAYDLLNEDGEVVLPAGVPVSESLLLHTTQTGYQVLYLASEDREPQPYSDELQRNVETFFEDSPAIVADLSNLIFNGGRISQDELDVTIDQCLESIQRDESVVLSAAIGMSSAHEPSARNVRMSSLAMVTAQVMGYSEADCKAVGRAGLMCDVSISPSQPSLDSIPPETSQYDRALAHYLQHPTRSAELLRRGIEGISDLELVLVTQVHEQSDGSGFPRGLKKHHLHPLSRLLNTIDAFLTLTDPTTPSGKVVPADALAYLVLHSLYGVFDRDCIRALVKTAAIYPIGTEVVLDDQSTGIVMRSGNSDYMEPIVKILETNQMVDLRGNQRMIVGPIADGKNWLRLSKSRLTQSLWTKAA